MDYSVMALKDAYYDLSTTPNGHGGAAQCERLKEDGTCTEMEWVAIGFGVVVFLTAREVALAGTSSV
jgi:hypothetical protein